jgi:hypothetical protein
MRFGIALKDMDSLARHVAYRYLAEDQVIDDIEIDTLSIDRMTSYQNMSINKDFRMIGYVIYVGS